MASIGLQSVPGRVSVVVRAAALAAGALALAGCQGLSRIQPVSQVRVIHVSPDAPALDIRQTSAQPRSVSGQMGLYNLSFGTVSSYMPISPGTYTQAAYTAGTQQQLASVHGKVLDGGQYTLLTSNIVANLQMTLLRDRSTPAPAGQVALRFLHQATRVGPVDLYLQRTGDSVGAMTPIAAGLAFGRDTDYITVPAGTFSMIVMPAGSALSSAPAFTTAQVSYPSTAVRSILLVDGNADDAAAPPLQIITATDYDPPAM